MISVPRDSADCAWHGGVRAVVCAACYGDRCAGETELCHRSEKISGDIDLKIRSEKAGSSGPAGRELRGEEHGEPAAEAERCLPGVCH